MFYYRLDKLIEREFKKAIIIIADVWFFKNEELIPYIHPKFLLILGSKSSKKSEEEKKNESSEEDSEEEIDTKRKIESEIIGRITATVIVSK